MLTADTMRKLEAKVFPLVKRLALGTEPGASQAQAEYDALISTLKGEKRAYVQGLEWGYYKGVEHGEKGLNNAF